MKKLLFLFLLCIPIWVHAISAESAIVMDMDSKRVLYSLNANQEKLIASTTKIMTAIIAIENSKLDQKITVGEEILKAYGSSIYIEVGEEITLEDALYGLMLRSGNDAALLISKSVANSVSSFVELMNQKAVALNMNHTHFVNPHGLEEDDNTYNTSTAYDMALLMTYAMQNDFFRKIVSTKNYVAKTNQKTYHWENKNRLLEEYSYTTGGKTGYTKKAKRTLVTTASKDGKNLCVVTLNDGNDFSDHKTLYETFFNTYEKVEVLKRDDFLPEGSVYKQDQVYLRHNFSLLVKPVEKKFLRLSFQFNQDTNQKNGRQVGVVEVYLKDEKITTEPIYYQESQNSSHSLSWWQKFVRWLKAW